MRNRKFLRSYGFTLIEIIVVISILAALTAVALPRIGAKDLMAKLRLRGSAQQTLSSIRYTRRLAVTYGSTNSAGYTINFYNANGSQTAPYAQYKIVNNGDSSIVEERPIDPENPDQPEISCTGDNSFTFLPLGNATSGGTLTLSRAGQTLTITIEEATGIVFME